MHGLFRYLASSVQPDFLEIDPCCMYIKSLSFSLCLSGILLYTYATVYEFSKNHFLSGAGESLWALLHVSEWVPSPTHQSPGPALTGCPE